MTLLRAGPWQNAPRTTLGRQLVQRTRISSHESHRCGIVFEFEHFDANISTHTCSQPQWVSPHTLISLPCCDQHIDNWLSLIGVAGAIKHRVIDPHTNKLGPALILPTHVQQYMNGRCFVFYHFDSKTSVITLTREEAQVAADEVECLGAHDGVDLSKKSWFARRLRALVIELDPTRANM